MKQRIAPILWGGFVALGLFITGCGKGGGIDTADLDAAFVRAEPEVKATATTAVQALKAGKFLDGATALANLARSAESLSEDQKNAMINVGAMIQVVMAEDGDKADLAVYQAVEDMMAALDGREASTVGTDPDRVRPPEEF
ncbi:MAG: hypothetical protein KF833_14755 [Verrucomicrobiae bacterium]|nr:hypothetical protein [Verrucomicrobiae bacterium]